MTREFFPRMSVALRRHRCRNLVRELVDLESRMLDILSELSELSDGSSELAQEVRDLDAVLRQ